jgi:type VI protein secretion system component Hcp
MTALPEPTRAAHRPRRWRWLAATGAGALLVTAGALVDIGGAADQDPTIHACVSDKGAVRIVAATTTCLRGETAASWNQQGPVGPTGPAGPVGPSGSGGAPVPNELVVGDMTIDGIVGPNADGSIDLRSFTETITSGSASSGSVSGKPIFSPIAVTKVLDGSSPALLTRAAQGQAIPEVTIRVFAPGSTTVVATYFLETVSVVSDAAVADGSSPGRALEHVALGFRRITVTVDGSSFTYDTLGEQL